MFCSFLGSFTHPAPVLAPTPTTEHLDSHRTDAAATAKDMKATTNADASATVLLRPSACKVSIATVELTPQQGDNNLLSGYSSLGHRASDKTPPFSTYELVGSQSPLYRGLFATAQCIAPASSPPLVLVSVDLHCSSAFLSSSVSSAVHAKYPHIPASNVIITGTHTHSGPGQYYGNPLFDCLTVANHLPGFNSQRASRLVSLILSAIDASLSTLLPGTLSVVESTVVGACSNRAMSAFRRNEDAALWCTPGWPGASLKASGDKLAEEDLCVDPRVRAFVVQPDDDNECDGKSGRGSWGSLALFSCHPTSLGGSVNYYDSDWVGCAKLRCISYLRSHPSFASLPPPTVGFMQSACGDISPLPIVTNTERFETNGSRGPRPGVQGPLLKEAIGNIVGEGLGRAVAMARAAREEARAEAEARVAVPDETSGKRKAAILGTNAKRSKSDADSKAATSLEDIDVNVMAGGELTIEVAHEIWDVATSYKEMPATSFFGGWGGGCTSPPGAAAAAPGSTAEPADSSKALGPGFYGLATLGGAPCGQNPAFFKHFRNGYPSNTLSVDHPQYPKTPIPLAETVLPRIGPRHLPLWVALVGSVCIATVPGEPSIMAARRIEMNLLEELESVGVVSVIVFGFTGDYAGYWVTEEEYDQQLYEGSSTLFGRSSVRTLIGKLRALALKAKADRETAKSK